MLVIRASRAGANAFEDARGGLATQALLACLEAQLGEQKDLAAARLLIAAVIKAFQERADE